MLYLMANECGNVGINLFCLNLNRGESTFSERVHYVLFSATSNKDFEVAGGVLNKAGNAWKEQLPVLKFIQGIHYEKDLVKTFRKFKKLCLKFLEGREFGIARVLFVELFQVFREDFFLAGELLDDFRHDLCALLNTLILVVEVYKCDTGLAV